MTKPTPSKSTRDLPPKKDPTLRRAPINRIQAEQINVLQQELEAAKKVDAGTIRAQTALCFYLSAITHGDGERRPCMTIGLENGSGSKMFLVYRPSQSS